MTARDDCIWCGNSKSDPESPHHRLCCRDQYPPYCGVCFVDVTAERPRVDEDDVAADRMHGDAR